MGRVGVGVPTACLKRPPVELLFWDNSLGLPPGLEAFVMTPNSVMFLLPLPRSQFPCFLALKIEFP